MRNSLIQMKRVSKLCCFFFKKEFITVNYHLLENSHCTIRLQTKELTTRACAKHNSTSLGPLAHICNTKEFLDLREGNFTIITRIALKSTSYGLSFTICPACDYVLGGGIWLYFFSKAWSANWICDSRRSLCGWGGLPAVPLFKSNPGICLTSEENHEKPQSN
jgi:hypothetical protein